MTSHNHYYRYRVDAFGGNTTISSANPLLGRRTRSETIVLCHCHIFIDEAYDAPWLVLAWIVSERDVVFFDVTYDDTYFHSCVGVNHTLF